MRRNKFAFGFLLIGILLISLGNFTITGGIINSYLRFSLYQIIGLIFIIGSFILFVSKHTLDAIIIPTGPSYEGDIQRVKRAVKESEENKRSYFVISGTLGDKKLSESQRANIYRELRKSGIKPSQISIEGKSRNTVENLIYSLEKIKERGGYEVGIASYPGHLERFKDIFERARKEGVIDKNFHLHKLPTRTRKNQTTKEDLYEMLSGILHRYKLRHRVKEALISEDEPLIKIFKKSWEFCSKSFQIKSFKKHFLLF